MFGDVGISRGGQRLTHWLTITRISCPLFAWFLAVVGRDFVPHLRGGTGCQTYRPAAAGLHSIPHLVAFTAVRGVRRTPYAT